jgi:hypothetical protein
MAKDADVHIAVTSDRKQRWEEYVEQDPNLGSMTELVRHGVEDYIERSQSGGDDGVQEIDWEPVLQPLNELQGGMEEAVQGIEEINDRVGETKKAVELADTIYPLLPEASSPSDLDDARRELGEDATDRELAEATGDARHFAEMLNREMTEVLDAMVLAENKNPEVQLYDNGESLEAYIYAPSEAGDGEGE